MMVFRNGLQNTWFRKPLSKAVIVPQQDYYFSPIRFKRVSDNAFTGIIQGAVKQHNSPIATPCNYKCKST